MALPRPSCLRGAQRFGRTAFRRTANQARSSPFRHAGRRTYASGHEAKQSSDLPWMIGAVVFTVPAATWLLGQAPEKSSHGDHGHEEKHEEAAEEEPQEESKDEGEDKSEESQTDSTDSKDEKEEKTDDEDAKKDDESDSKDDSKDDSAAKDEDKSDTPDDEENEGPSSGRKAQYFRNPNKKPGEGQKGDRPPTEKKGEKDAQSNFSGAKHPYIDHPEKSKKSAGPTETAKIHGTAKPTYANEDPKQDPPPKDDQTEKDEE